MLSRPFHLGRNHPSSHRGPCRLDSRDAWQLVCRSGEVTGFVGEFVIKMLARLQQKTVLERTEWTDDLKKKQWVKWRIRRGFWLIV